MKLEIGDLVFCQKSKKEAYVIDLFEQYAVVIQKKRGMYHPEHWLIEDLIRSTN